MILWFFACTGEEATPVVPPPAPPVEAPPPAAPTVWTKDNIAELVPVAPSRATTVGKAIPALEKYDTTLTTLGSVIDTYAGDPDNPWAIAHGVLARGPEFRLSDGRPAVPHLFSSFAEERTIGTHSLLGFPRALGEIRVEPHTDLLLKNLGEVGVLPETVYPTRIGDRPVADLYRYTLIKTFLQPAQNKSSYDGPNDIPWGVQALAQWAPPGELQWIASDGTTMDLDDLATFNTAVITQESAFMFDAMQKKQSFTRQGQALFAYTCGGSHLVQGASYAIARGYGTPRDRKMVEAQAPLLFYRLPIELDIVDEALKTNPRHKTRLLVQRMKFLGHFLETISKMQAMGLFVPTDDQIRTVEGAAQNLVVTVEALKKAGVFDNMAPLREKDEQLYLDVIGDACHAVRGLELALGRSQMRW